MPSRRSSKHCLAAIRGADDGKLALHAAIARLRLAALRKGAERERLLSEATTYLTAQGIARPERFAAMLAPGFERTVSQPPPGAP